MRSYKDQKGRNAKYWDTNTWPLVCLSLHWKLEGEHILCLWNPLICWKNGPVNHLEINLMKSTMKYYLTVLSPEGRSEICQIYILGFIIFPLLHFNPVDTNMMLLLISNVSFEFEHFGSLKPMSDGLLCQVIADECGKIAPPPAPLSKSQQTCLQFHQIFYF